MNNEYIKFQILEKGLIAYYNEKYSNIDDMKLFEKIENIKSREEDIKEYEKQIKDIENW